MRCFVPVDNTQGFAFHFYTSLIKIGMYADRHLSHKIYHFVFSISSSWKQRRRQTFGI